MESGDEESVIRSDVLEGVEGLLGEEVGGVGAEREA